MTKINITKQVRGLYLKMNMTRKVTDLYLKMNITRKYFIPIDNYILL